MGCGLLWKKGKTWDKLVPSVFNPVINNQVNWTKTKPRESLLFLVLEFPPFLHTWINRPIRYNPLFIPKNPIFVVQYWIDSEVVFFWIQNQSFLGRNKEGIHPGCRSMVRRLANILSKKLVEWGKKVGIGRRGNSLFPNRPWRKQRWRRPGRVVREFALAVTELDGRALYSGGF